MNLATISYLLIDSLYHSRHTKVSENSFSEQFHKFQTFLSCQKEARFVEIISFVLVYSLIYFNNAYSLTLLDEEVEIDLLSLG